MGYTIENFAAICQITDSPNIFTVHKDSGITSFEQFLELARDKPGAMTYGTCGAGLTQNIFMEGFLNANDMSGLLTHVPFDGGSASVTGLMGRQVDSILNASPEVVPNIENGTFLALAQTGEKRIENLSEVPTLRELGFEQAGGVWYGYVAPAGTPEEVIAVIDNAFKEAMDDEAIMQALLNLKNEISYLDHAQFQEKLTVEYETYKEIIDNM